MDLKEVIGEFAAQIQDLLQAQAEERAKAEILGAFGIGAPRKPGRPPKTAAATPTVAAPVAKKARKKMPPQYCPVPYCRNVAAPIFGMVCAKHKDVPKALIKKYREERRAKKEGVKPAKKTPVKRAKRVVKKAKRGAAVPKKKAPAKRTAPVAKKAAKRPPAAKKKRTKPTEPIAKETAAPAPPAVSAA